VSESSACTQRDCRSDLVVVGLQLPGRAARSSGHGGTLGSNLSARPPGSDAAGPEDPDQGNWMIDMFEAD